MLCKIKLCAVLSLLKTLMHSEEASQQEQEVKLLVATDPTVRYQASC